MTIALTKPALSAIQAYQAAARSDASAAAQKARKAADGFESTFLQTMLEGMMAGLGQEGPLGGGQAGAGAWRGFLVEEYAKGMSRAGTIGIAPQVFREMLRHQESQNASPSR
jgi:Rod binding domain-containing protein